MHFFSMKIEPLFRVLRKKKFGIILHEFLHRILSAEFRRQRPNNKQKSAWKGLKEWTLVRKFGIQFLVIHFKLCVYGVPVLGV